MLLEPDSPIMGDSGRMNNNYTRDLKENLDAVIDANVCVEDPANPGKWVTTGAANYPTTDGTHPSPALHLLASQLVRAWASGLTAG